MSSLRRIHSCRANAARSRGPITVEGQERSSANAIRHALLARCVVLENELGPCFDDLVTLHTQRFAPADGVEFGIVEEMAAAYWRMRRTRAIENRLMEKALRHQPPGGEAAPIADAFAELAASPELNLLHRYKTRRHRIYQRALCNLALLGERVVPNEPSPISGHLGTLRSPGFCPQLAHSGPIIRTCQNPRLSVFIRGHNSFSRSYKRSTNRVKNRRSSPSDPRARYLHVGRLVVAGDVVAPRSAPATVGFLDGSRVFLAENSKASIEAKAAKSLFRFLQGSGEYPPQPPNPSPCK